MKNHKVTFNINEQVINKAKVAAKSKGDNLNELIREFIKLYGEKYNAQVHSDGVQR